jgi:ketosteroid isomerase-like protein
MRRGAGTPEELETLLEDAFVNHDQSALRELFEDGAVLQTPKRLAAHGRAEIERAAAEMWAGNDLFLAAPMRIMEARGTALIAAANSTNVARRDRDGSWRYLIALLGCSSGTPVRPSP